MTVTCFLWHAARSVPLHSPVKTRCEAHRITCYLRQVPPASIATCNVLIAGTHSLWDNRHTLHHCTQQCCWGRHLLRTDHKQMHKPHLALFLTQLIALQEATISQVCLCLTRSRVWRAATTSMEGNTCDAEAQHGECANTKRWTPCHSWYRLLQRLVRWSRILHWC